MIYKKKKLDYNKINYKNRTIKPIWKGQQRREVSISHFFEKKNCALSPLLTEERDRDRDSFKK